MFLRRDSMKYYGLDDGQEGDETGPSTDEDTDRNNSSSSEHEE